MLAVWALMAYGAQKEMISRRRKKNYQLLNASQKVLKLWNL